MPLSSSTVSSMLGSFTVTGWKRLSRALSLSIYFLIKEETGAEDFKIKHICYYTERSETQNNIKSGALFVAEIFSIDKELHSEMEKIELFDEIPENLTYPEVTEKLIEKIKSIRSEV